MLLAAVVAVCVASHAVASPTAVPLPEKVYYDLEDAENLFKEHITKYQRKYNGEEYNKRLDIFQTTLKEINYLNAKYPRTVFGVTRFSDWTPEEMKEYNGFIPINYTTNNRESKLYPNVEAKEAPNFFDWRLHGAVTRVKDQGDCGSCYIFSAIANIEGQYAIKHKKLVSLSEQQCLDCLPDTSCYGGIPFRVMTNLTKSAGLMDYDDYPYHAIDHQQCQEKPDKVVAKVTGAEVLNIKNAEDLKQKLLEIGPLSVGVDSTDFRSYVGGVLTPYGCGSSLYSLDHAVLLVGYGEDNGDKYWSLKNSWGEHHGESGYVRLLRGVNACGVENTEYIINAHVA